MRPKNTRPSPIPNPSDPTGSTVLIELTQGKYAIIDASDAARCISAEGCLG